MLAPLSDRLAAMSTKTKLDAATPAPAPAAASPLEAIGRDRTSFDPAPSLRRSADVVIETARAAAADVGVIGVTVGVKGPVPKVVGLDRSTLTAAGFEGEPGQTFVAPRRDAADVIAIGVGDGGLSTTEVRDAAAAFARAAGRYSRLATNLHNAVDSDPAAAAQAVVEGVLLARYRFGSLKNKDEMPTVEALWLLGPAADVSAIRRGIARGRARAGATQLARDLANTPPSHLTATRIAQLAEEIAAATGLEIEVCGPEALRDLGCGGLLGVNAGSIEEPRMIKLTYRPKRTRASAAKLALVGKGIMYDSGGISLKSTDAMHVAMKMDMSGAAAVLSTMSALSALDCPNEVVGFMMCTDNMPSGSAMKLGDVLHIHGGTTVEVHNTDAEGRLVLADGLALAAEEQPDAIVDIATLTGACVVALGLGFAGVFGSNQQLVDQVTAAAAETDEPAWQLPLERTRYRKLLDSEVADMKNVGGPYGGAITAAVFLSEFVGDVPWAHIDFAGPMKVDGDESWRTKGATGYGTRLLIELATTFTKPSA